MDSNWVAQYIEYLKSDNFEEMLPLKMRHFPSSFYKYRVLNERTIESIECDSLWMSEFDKLNDTFECSLILDNKSMLRDFFTKEDNVRLFKAFGYTVDELNSIRSNVNPFGEFKRIAQTKGIEIPLTEQQQLERVQSAWKKDEMERNSNIRICSFSTINDSLLMWAHYSDEYRGICIEYDLLDSDTLRPWIQPVHYTDFRVRVQNFEEINARFNVVASVTKSTHWEYEKEWRLTYYLKHQLENGNKVKLPIPKAIYLGPSFEKNASIYKHKLKELAARKGIQLIQMDIHETEYMIIPSGTK